MKECTGMKNEARSDFFEHIKMTYIIERLQDSSDQMSLAGPQQHG